ncbi:phage major capsid protein [Sphingomonas sp.]|uniref:phage major capsid protein n=1 Tax=Sphingomonas sp. TaxID=28214 RepID=UPI002DD62806|nr:phage major capsid protein [Sphingomonas sp.]
MHMTALPRALTRSGGRIMANGSQNPETLFRELRTAVEAHISRNSEQVTNIEAALQAVQHQVNGGAGGGAITVLPVDGPYTSAFASYARRGDGVDALKLANASGDRATVHAAMSVGTATDGGYLAPVEWDRQLHERQRATSPMRRLANVQITSVGAFTSLWNGDEWGSGWVGETAARPQTTTATLAPIPFGTGEIYANAAATQRLLDDAAINVDSWLIQSLDREFTRQENIAFLSGNGINKPSGLLTFAVGGSNAAAHPGGPIAVAEIDIDYDGLVDFLYGLGAPYRQNASWLMSSLTAAAIAKLKDANGTPIWREGLIVGQPATLLGRPVEIDEGMPAPVAGNLAIAFGDFKAGYLINDRIGTRVLRDPYTNKPFVMFYATKRVGAGVLDPNAIRLLKVAA